MPDWARQIEAGEPLSIRYIHGDAAGAQNYVIVNNHAVTKLRPCSAMPS
jgi:hypothetical protein